MGGWARWESPLNRRTGIRDVKTFHDDGTAGCLPFSLFVTAPIIRAIIRNFEIHCRLCRQYETFHHGDDRNWPPKICIKPRDCVNTARTRGCLKMPNKDKKREEGSVVFFASVDSFETSLSTMEENAAARAPRTRLGSARYRREHRGERFPDPPADLCLQSIQIPRARPAIIIIS